MVAAIALSLIGLSVEFMVALQDQINIPAASGQNINISCEVSDEKSIITVEWRRAEDPEDEHVIVYRNGKMSPDDQLKQFKGRVNLTIRERSLSLILKNVTTNDSGTFECRVQRPGSDGMEQVCTRNLKVSPPEGNQDGNRNDGENQDGSDGPSNDGARTGIIAAVAAVVVAVVVIKKKNSSDPSQTPSGAAVDESSQQIEMGLMSDQQISGHPEVSAAQ
ncbi:coxsackievirus and adenovirus receptor homolog [Poecilia formosa]|uniref:coxsackievirus and adenovirus receptor homolog n=1 Tax=Poecilia formosa TaxID=48698 RepID=UPI000444357E|nr:PREDICTED: coxsackievirus and adenovirus receptor homolog [Poecilia formosa]